MKKLMLKLVLFGLIVSMLVSVAGCAPAATETAPAATAAPAAIAVPAKPIKVGFSAINLADEVVARMVRDMFAAAKDYNEILTTADCGGDPAKQINDVESMVSAGEDVIIIQALNPQGLDPVVKEAMSKGIKIVAHGIGLDNYDVWYKNDNYAVGQAIGKMAGEWINANAGGKAKVAMIEFPLVPVLVTRAQGIQDGLNATAPNAEIVARGSGIDTDTGMKLAETFLQQDPQIQVIVSISDGPLLGAFEAAKAAGRNNKDFALFGSDLAPAAVADIAAGSAYRGTIDTDSKISGRKEMEIAFDLATGKPIDKVIVMGVVPVTIKNISEYTQ
jgi:ribose transport system substrate-binding protein